MGASPAPEILWQLLTLGDRLPSQPFDFSL
jgi:hypothetical protein